MHVVSRYTAADAAGIIEPRGRAIALSVAFAAGALLLNMVPVIGVTGTLSLLTALNRRLRCRVGIHTWAVPALSLAPGGDALGLSAVGGRLAAGAGGLVWRAGLVRHAAGRGVRRGGAAVAWRIAAGRSAQCGPRVDGATLLSVVVVIAATLLAQHTAGAGRSGVCFAFAVLLDLSLLGALIVRIRQQESAA